MNDNDLTGREGQSNIGNQLGDEQERTTAQTFGWAIKQTQNGHRVRRAGWNGKGMWIALQVPDDHSKMKRPYLYMSPIDGELVPWVASQSDILEVDWELAL